MHGVLQVGPLEAGAGDDLVQAGQACLRGIGVGGQALAAEQLAVRLLEDEVSERAPDVEADAEGDVR